MNVYITVEKPIYYSSSSNSAGVKGSSSYTSKTRNFLFTPNAVTNIEIYKGVEEDIEKHVSKKETEDIYKMISEHNRKNNTDQNKSDLSISFCKAIYPNRESNDDCLGCLCNEPKINKEKNDDNFLNIETGRQILKEMNVEMKKSSKKSSTIKNIDKKYKRVLSDENKEKKVLFDDKTQKTYKKALSKSKFGKYNKFTNDCIKVPDKYNLDELKIIKNRSVKKLTLNLNNNSNEIVEKRRTTAKLNTESIELLNKKLKESQIDPIISNFLSEPKAVTDAIKQSMKKKKFLKSKSISKNKKKNVSSKNIEIKRVNEDKNACGNNKPRGFNENRKNEFILVLSKEN